MDDGSLFEKDKKFYVEVKGHLHSFAGFEWSKNEYECAKVKGDAYVVIGVTLFPNPKVAYVLRNPSKMAFDDELKMNPSSFFVDWKPQPQLAIDASTSPHSQPHTLKVAPRSKKIVNKFH